MHATTERSVDGGQAADAGRATRWRVPALRADAANLYHFRKRALPDRDDRQGRGADRDAEVAEW